MPAFSGVSQIGVQVAGNYDAVQGTWVVLEVPQFESSDRLTRVGLLIIGSVNGSGQVRVVEVFKVFSHGVFVLPRYPVLPFRYNLSVQWFIAGVQWNALTP